METLTNLDYGDALARLNGRARRKLGNNTYSRREDDGRVIVRYHATDVLTFDPSGDVTYSTGGWLTSTTKERLNTYGARGARIWQERGRWYMRYQGTTSDYYDDMVLNDGTITTGVVRSGDPDKDVKRAIDRYVKGYTEDVLAELVKRAGEQGTAGDCWYCAMRVNGTDTALGEHTGDHGHLSEHVREDYRMATLALNAVQAAGYRYPAVILAHGDLTRRAIRRYLRQRLATHTAGAAGGTKPIARAW